MSAFPFPPHGSYHPTLTSLSFGARVKAVVVAHDVAQSQHVPRFLPVGGREVLLHQRLEHTPETRSLSGCLKETRKAWAKRRFSGTKTVQP